MKTDEKPRRPLQIPPELFGRLAEAFQHIRDLDRFLEILADSVREAVAARNVRIETGGEPKLVDVAGIARNQGELRIENSEICIPLAIRGRMLGTLHILPEEESNPFHPQDLFLLSSLSDFVAAVLDGALPAARPPDAAPGESADAFRPPPPPSAEALPAVVVVHPREGIAASLRWILESEYRILHSPTADDLYHRLDHDPPAAVVVSTEIDFPEPGEIIRGIRERRPEIPVLTIEHPGGPSRPIREEVSGRIRPDQGIREIRDVIRRTIGSRSEARS